MPTLLSLKQVSYGYGPVAVITQMSFTLEQGEIACLLGHSGCGKTTLLRCIAGFETLCGGKIELAGTVMSTPNQHVPAHLRKVGMVFQDYALLPHLTVADNVGFGLRGLPSRQRRVAAMCWLQKVGLANWAQHYPHELSGGQQQRVALARALAAQPRLLLLDEPFSNLDVDLRACLSRDVRAMLKNQGMTAIMVTHDQNEAFIMADRVGVMQDGRLLQWDTPYRLYHEPVTRCVADFIGQGVFLPGEVVDCYCVRLEIGEFCGSIPLRFMAGDQVHVLLRPENVQYDPSSPIQALIEDKVFRGADFHYILVLPSGQKILARVPSYHNHPVGGEIGIRLALEHLIAFA